MPDDTGTRKITKVCRNCGLVHEVDEPAPPKSDEWKLIGLSVAGVGLLILLWVWVFRWGVPLVRYLKNLD